MTPAAGRLPGRAVITVAMASASLILRAPVSGRVVPLHSVPDPVFSQYLLGQGVSIEPSGATLVAPCNGRVIHLHPAGHAVTILTAGGTEVLMHIGLGKGQRQGAGFVPRVEVGALVGRGAALIDFDPHDAAAEGHSLLTQVVVTNSATILWAAEDGIVQAGRDPILEVTQAPPQPARAIELPPDRAETLASTEAVVVDPDGLHARPAARISVAARRFGSEVWVECGGRAANAKSMLSVLALRVGAGDSVRLVALGPDALQAVDAVRATLGELPPAEAASTPPDGNGERAEGDDGGTRGRNEEADAASGLLRGAAASPGIAVGHVLQARRAPIQLAERGADAGVEHRSLDHALERARREIGALRARVQGDPADVLDAQATLLDDPDVLALARASVDAGYTAAFSWGRAFTRHLDRVDAPAGSLPHATSGAPDHWGGNSDRAAPRGSAFTRRVMDAAWDAREHVLALLTAARPIVADGPDPIVLVARDITTADLALLDRSRVLGVCTVSGGPSSHVAILARALGIPAVTGAPPEVLDVPDGTPVLLDGGHGVLVVDPSPEAVDRAERSQPVSTEPDPRAANPARTGDGRHILVTANASTLADAGRAAREGADGIGLLRSEFLFVDRTTAPSEDEQACLYEAFVRTLGPDRPVVIRTLDAGGDKPLPYLSVPREDNPFLGERGVRLLLNRPEQLVAQARAIVRASLAGRVRAMLPMVATLEEWRIVRDVFEREAASLGAPRVPLGIMVEVPSVALLADRFADEVDFFSIGTNDLARSTLAIDRAHPGLAPRLDSLHPAVLQLIGRTVDAAHARGKPVAVCGGVAADEQGIPVLIGLGVDELSVPASAVPLIKASVCALLYRDCVALARRALMASTAAEVRELAGARLEE